MWRVRVSDSGATYLWYEEDEAFLHYLGMMTSSHGDAFRITDPLWGESTSNRWILLTNSSAEIWRFFAVRLNTRLNKQRNCLCFWTVVWRHGDGHISISLKMSYHWQVSFKKEVVVRVNDLVFWLTAWLNFENVLLTLKWYVFVWQKCSMLTKYANGHFFNKWNCVSMP